MTREALGLFGLGLMGEAMAERALAGGFRVIGHDPEPERREALARLGAVTTPNPPEVLSRADTIVYSVPTTARVRESLASLDSHLRPGMRLVDTTTGDPDDMAALGRELGARDVGYLDATIAGSSAEVRQGRVLALVGGEASLLEACRPFLECFASRIFHLGECGRGARMKLVFNLVLGLHRAVLAEGLSLARNLGIDEGTALGILKAGGTRSRVMETKGERMTARDFDPPQARLAQHRKDVEILLALGERHGIDLPLCRVHRELLDRAIAKGGGALDNSAIIGAYEESRMESGSTPISPHHSR